MDFSFEKAANARNDLALDGEAAGRPGDLRSRKQPDPDRQQMQKPEQETHDRLKSNRCARENCAEFLVIGPGSIPRAGISCSDSDGSALSP